MKTRRQQSGQAAEDTVLAAAKKRGLRQLARNYRTRRGELDLVLTAGDTLVVVEVRLRRRSDYGSAVESVTNAKQGRIIAATRQFLVEHPQWAESPVRFDVVGVDAQGRLDWIDNAFLA